jgi:hypothetical protein
LVPAPSREGCQRLSPSEAKNKSVGSLAQSEELIPQQYVA